MFQESFPSCENPKLSFENLNQPFLASFKSSKEAFNYVPPSFPKFSSPFIFCLGLGGGGGGEEEEHGLSAYFYGH